MKNSTRVKQDLIQAVTDGFINYQQLAVACLEMMSDKQVKDMCINNDFKLELDDDTTQGFIVESGEAAIIGYDTDRTVYHSKEEADKAFDKAVEHYIIDTALNNNFTEQDTQSYREEIAEENTDVNIKAIRSVADPDGEWYVAMYSAN